MLLSNNIEISTVFFFFFGRKEYKLQRHITWESNPISISKVDKMPWEGLRWSTILWVMGVNIQSYPISCVQFPSR